MAVINPPVISSKTFRVVLSFFIGIPLALITLVPILAAVLPEDRADILYHSYNGGGIEITGPSILVRKLIGKSNSISANYYIDAITSASIDVMTSASPYTEKRTENSLGLDYLHEKTTMSISHTTSTENDFDAESVNFNISQDVFGDLTTITLGISRGWDTVGKTGDLSFSEDVDRQGYRLGLSQILSKNMIMGITLDTITDEGFLNNPYRSVRYLDLTVPQGYSLEAEKYPRTRTSNAFAIRALYYLPYRASVNAEYRIYSDSWGIDASNYGIGYTHPLSNKKWIFDAHFRYYSQTQADFYSDLFPFQQAQNFLARDKELSTFDNTTIGLGVSYEFPAKNWEHIDRGSLNLVYDHIQFNYDNFRNITVVTTPGTEPSYAFSADTLQLFLSIWY